MLSTLYGSPEGKCCGKKLGEGIRRQKTIGMLKSGEGIIREHLNKDLEEWE